MREESCRKCGGTLLVYAKCIECGQSIQETCKICGISTIEKVHIICLQLNQKEVIAS